MRRLRIGSVPYFNAWPLIWPLLASPSPGIRVLTCEPPELRRRLARGQVDVGLLSSIEYFRSRIRFGFVPGLGICSRGPVTTVKLLLRRPPERVRSLALDRHSLTANSLARIILEQRHGRTPRLGSFDATQGSWKRCRADAAVVIGDRAFAFHRTRHLDLGDAWTRWKRLPFVYALWLYRQDNPRRRRLYDPLKRAAQAGSRSIREIARAMSVRTGLDLRFCIRYLRDSIHYRVGPRELRGLKEFGKCLKQLR